MEQKLNSLALGYSVAILSAACMLLVGIAGYLGIYAGLVELMMQGHLFFDISIVGIIGGMIEGAAGGFVGGFLFGYIYNWFA
jgi:hypothetical protein